MGVLLQVGAAEPARLHEDAHEEALRGQRDDPARQVARETGAVYGGVLYVDSLSKSEGPVPTYIDLLEVTTSRVMNGLVNGLK